MTPRSLKIAALLLALAPSVWAGETKVEGGPGAAPTPVVGADLQKLAPLSPSLSPTSGLQTGEVQTAGEIPRLPTPLAQTGAPGATAVSPEAKPGEWNPSSVLKEGSAVVPEARAARVEPYFVGALTRLGVPQDLAEKLADYQTSRHPGDQGKVYHGLGHSQDVPAVVSAIVENQHEMTDRQKVLLIVAAVFHDIDPERKPGTPARVSATLAYLEKDPDSVKLLSELGRRFGVMPDQVAAMIKATDFNPDPAAQKQIQADFEDMARRAFPGNESAWAVDWGRRLSFADKSATYLGSVEASDTQVRNLAREIRAAVEQATGQEAPDRTEFLLRGSRNFLKALKDSPDFAMLPSGLKRNFNAVYAHFERLADPATPIPDENAQARGPPVTANLTVTRLARAPEAVSRDLSGLNSVGYAVLSPGAMMTAKAEQAVLDIVERDWMKDGEPKFSQIPFEDRAQPAWAPRVVGIRAALDPIIEELTGQLNAVLAGEDIEVRDVQLRLATPDKPERQGIHVDLGGYMTATYALRGRGTILYRTLPDGRVQAMEAPTHSWAIINNLEREAATDIPGTVHDTPITDRPRVLLIIRFVRRGQKIADDERKVYQERGRKRAAAVTTALANQGLKPAPPKKGILSKLFGE